MKVSRIINLFLLLGLAIFLAVWSLKALSSSELVEKEGWMTTDELVFGELMYFDRTNVATINDRDTVVIFAGSEAILKWDELEKHLVVYLEKGAALASTYAGDVIIDVRADGFASVRSYKNIIYAEMTEDSQELNAYSLVHPSKVSFVHGGQELNSLCLPAGYRMRVPEVKITDTLSKLRITKLAKEFPHYDIDEDDLDDAVLARYIETDSVYTQWSLDYLSDLQSNGELGPETEGFAGVLNDFYGDFREIVTVLPHAEDRLVEESEEAMLTYAMTNYLIGEEETGDYWVSQWNNLDHDFEVLERMFNDLYFVLPGDDLYPVKAAISAILFDGEDSISGLKNGYREIEDLIDFSRKVEAQEAYAAYKIAFENALNNGAFDDGDWVSIINQEYMLLELLLRSNSIFYDIDSVSLLGSLEAKILQLVGNDEDLDEERQSFVQSKLRFLENLFDFVVEDKVSIEQASDLADSLIYDAEVYMGEITSSNAVLKYFDNKLEAYGLAVDFMNSPEFESYDSFEEGLADYTSKVSDLEDLNDYIQDLRDGGVGESSITLEEALDEAATDLLYAGIQYNDLLSLDEVSYRLFEIQDARVSAHAFEANYDRETQILYDVVVGDVRFSTGLRLENAKDVIKALMEGDLDASELESDSDETESTQSSGSLLAGVAISDVESDFEDAGFDLDDFEFSVKDLDANTFNFEGVMLEARVPVSGLYNSFNGQVTLFVWEMDGEALALPATSLTNLESALEETYAALASIDSEG